MKQENQSSAAIAGIGAIVAVGTVVKFINTIRVERKKREKIKAWERERLICIAEAYTRLEKVMSNPENGFDDFVKAYKEEDEFLSLIIDQPMY